ncbi:MAG: GNAT family N-acetyltransferase [Clostridia bacterium]|nr:GNAT family N-acetyltransferase [Clostridia bacterium]
MNSREIDRLGIDRVMQRGRGEIVAEPEGALLVRDRISGALMLACDDRRVGKTLLDRYVDSACDLLMVADHALGMASFEQCGFSDKLECYQVVYCGDMPVGDDRLTYRVAEESDLPMLTATYRFISAEEIAELVKMRTILLGYDRDQLVGFVGEHLEGSMGLLHVFPEYRRQGYGSALQKEYMIRTMKLGFVPFGQVEKNNAASLCLQKKLGLQLSDNLIVWMWR